MKYLLLFPVLFLIGCTYSINMVHSEGQASDMIDENQNATSDISPTVGIPVI